MLSFLFSFFIVANIPQAGSGLGISGIDLSVPQGDSVKGRYLFVENIFIIGNQKTKENIILREMNITSGEYYYEEDLHYLIDQDRSKIINTSLFNTVEVSVLELSENKVDLIIKVTERWYTFPIPIFDLVDRNFNDWWQNQNHDLSRVNYGIKLYKNNARGRNEKLRIQLQLGYTKLFDIAYSIPYLERSQRHGLSLRYMYSENKNIPYQTVHHKREFLDSENLLKTERMYAIGYQFRNSFYTTHRLNLYYYDNDINDTVAVANPEFYLKNQTSQRYLYANYNFSFDKRNNISYPLLGSKLEINLRKYGFGLTDDLDQFDATLTYSKYFGLKKDFYLSNYSSAYFSSPEKQPYANLRGLGYKTDFVRGYELYVVEGKSFMLNRTTFKKKIFETRTHLNFIPIDQFKSIPIEIYLKTYFDMGFVENLENYSQNTRLSDRYLFGSGLGLDIVTYYDTVIRFEYSINRELEHGLFIHLKKEF